MLQPGTDGSPCTPGMIAPYRGDLQRIMIQIKTPKLLPIAGGIPGTLPGVERISSLANDLYADLQVGPEPV